MGEMLKTWARVSNHLNGLSLQFRIHRGRDPHKHVCWCTKCLTASREQSDGESRADPRPSVSKVSSEKRLSAAHTWRGGYPGIQSVAVVSECWTWRR